MAEALAARLEPVTPLRAIRDGFVVGVANPKSIVFFVVALPEFTSTAPGHLPVPAQMLILGALFPVIALVLDSACRGPAARSAAASGPAEPRAGAGADTQARSESMGPERPGFLAPIPAGAGPGSAWWWAGPSRRPARRSGRACRP
jgi:hypothetical protein